MLKEVLLKPENFESKPSFIGSTWPSREAEIVASRIVTMQRKISPDKWTPFSSEDYKRLSGHYVSQSELNLIDTLAGVKSNSASHHVGFDYLIKTDNDKYLITEKFIEMISKFSINN